MSSSIEATASSFIIVICEPTKLNFDLKSILFFFSLIYISMDVYACLRVFLENYQLEWNSLLPPLFFSTRVLNFEVENSTRFVCHNDCRQYSSIEFGMMDENLYQILILHTCTESFEREPRTPIESSFRGRLIQYQFMLQFHCSLELRPCITRHLIEFLYYIK